MIDKQIRAIKPIRSTLFLLVILYVMSFDLAASEYLLEQKDKIFIGEHNYENIVETKIAEVNTKIENSNTFREKADSLQALKEAAQKWSDDYYSVSLIQTTLEGFNFDDMKKEDCQGYLNKIHVGFDPQNDGIPRLPGAVEEIYNLISKACGLPLISIYRDGNNIKIGAYN